MKNKKLSTLFKHNRVNREVIAEVQKLLDIIKRYDLFEKAYWLEYFENEVITKEYNIIDFINTSVMSVNNTIEEYEELWIGERKEFSQYFFEDNICTEDLVLECIRYACEKLLKWTPKQACALFNARIVEMMKMRMMINYIEYPLELEKDKDYYKASVERLKEHQSQLRLF